MKQFTRGTAPTHEAIKTDIVWLNDLYQVNERTLDSGIVWLSIKRRDKECIHDWREMQLIKNMLCGAEREAVEIYPAESRLVDTSNQFHLWVLPEGERVPFGYEDRLIVTGQTGGHNKAGQRDFAPDETPADAITPEQADELAKNYTGGDLK